MNEPSNIHTKTIVNTTWDSAAGAIAFSFVFAFQNKDEYLTFRRLWKENYSALSVTIRTLKLLIATTMRKQEYAGELQVKVHKLKLEARMQLQMRKASRREANRQYL